MLSYRHAFHAGNHADVLKHYVLLQTLSYATQKDKPLLYVDTHAGAGMYALDKGYATQNAEFSGGISQLWQAPDLPASLQHYVSTIKGMNPPGTLSRYPGSPACAATILRADDKMRLFELHPTDGKLLIDSMGHHGRRVMVEAKDGFSGLKAVLPPPSRRAVVLIDPPYEQKEDYQRVVDSIKDSLQRFPTGTYIVWYPLLQRAEPLQMVEKLKKLQAPNWLNVSLRVENPSADGFGMFGSGLFIINPPWTLPKTLQESMPVLNQLLAKDDGASYILESELQ